MLKSTQQIQDAASDDKVLKLSTSSRPSVHGHALEEQKEKEIKSQNQFTLGEL